MLHEGPHIVNVEYLTQQTALTITGGLWMNCWGSKAPPALPPPYAPVASILTLYNENFATRSTNVNYPSINGSISIQPL